jgi:catechol 2,3-dioxygenase-like lactoylglutathione lyase family enzyme
MRFHTNLPVSDIDATARFYSVLFDGAPTKRKDDYVKFLPSAGGLNVSFHQASVEGKRLTDSHLTDLHLGFEMPDQKSLDAVHARLERAGLISAERETSVCCYANQDKFWVTDPDGYQWEFYVLLEDTERKMGRTSGCCASNTASAPCC